MASSSKRNFVTFSDFEEISSGDEGLDFESEEEVTFSEESEEENETIVDVQPNVRRNQPRVYDFVRNANLSIKNFPFTASSGIKIRNTKGLTAFGYVKLFITTTIMQMIVEETNRFGMTRHGMYWELIDSNDMWRFLALTILMGLNRKPTIACYWSKSSLYHQPIFSQMLARDRYLRILQCLHFVDNRIESTGKLHKLGKVYEEIVKRFQVVYQPQQHICIDESLSAWKGRVSFRQYIPSKRARFGIKSFVLAEAITGYVYAHHVYIGEEKRAAELAQMSITENIVMVLMSGLLGYGYKLFMDNYYNSPSLAKRLTDNLTYVCGTLRANRAGVPKDLHKNGDGSKLKKGQHNTFSDSDMMIGAWQDKKTISMISTMHTSCIPTDTGKQDRSGQEIKKPQCIQDYNK